MTFCDISDSFCISATSRPWILLWTFIVTCYTIHDLTDRDSLYTFSTSVNTMLVRHAAYGCEHVLIKLAHAAEPSVAFGNEVDR